MKKTIAIVAVIATLASCGGNETTTPSTTDSTKVTVDTTKTVKDTVKVAADTTKKVVKKVK